MSADNGWYVARDASNKWYVFGGFDSYVEEWWPWSEEYGPTHSLKERREYILRHPEHKSFDSKDEAIIYAHKLNDGEIDSYWNPKTSVGGYSTEYGVVVLPDLGFTVKP